jgi:hypothetical protein
MLVLSLLLLYQVRILAVIRVFALQAVVLALSVAWQAYLQNAPHLMVTAAIALVVKGLIIPFALERIVRRLDIHREVETVIGAGAIMLTGLALVALSILLLQPGAREVRPRLEGPTGPGGDPAWAPDDDHADQCGDADRRLHVARERAGSGRDRLARHAAGGGNIGRILDPYRVRGLWHFRVPHSRALRHRRCRRH